MKLFTIFLYYSVIEILKFHRMILWSMFKAIKIRFCVTVNNVHTDYDDTYFCNN